MPWKIATVVLAFLVLGESGYILLGRHRSINRFKAVDEDGYLAFDSASGQLCKTFRPVAAHKSVTPSPSPSSSPAKAGQSDRPDSGTPDLILEMIKRSKVGSQSYDDRDMAALHAALANKAQEEAKVEFIRGLPVCADIH